MKYFAVVLLFCTSLVHTQSINYNTKRGYIAEGYDVVAYFENNAVEGNKAFSTEHDGVTFKFISKEHLETFKANPEKYVPQYGGYCAYAIAENGKKIGINPETFEIRDGKLYLFYNTWLKDTYKAWKKENPALLKQKADENWNAIIKNEKLLKKKSF